MKYKTTGIVLKSIRYRDNDRIVQIFTREFGKVSYLVHAPASKRAVCRTPYLQALTLLSLEVDHRDKRDLQHIVEATPLKFHPDLLADTTKSAIAFFIAETVCSALYANEQDVNLFDYLEETAVRLNDATNGISLFPQQFLVEFAGLMGFYPSDSTENEFLQLLQPYDQTLFRAICQEEALSAVQRAEALQLLMRYFRFHLPSMHQLQSMELLLEVLG